MAALSSSHRYRVSTPTSTIKLLVLIVVVAGTMAIVLLAKPNVFHHNDINNDLLSSLTGVSNGIISLTHTNHASSPSQMTDLKRRKRKPQTEYSRHPHQRLEKSSTTVSSSSSSSSSSTLSSKSTASLSVVRNLQRQQQRRGQQDQQQEQNHNERRRRRLPGGEMNFDPAQSGPLILVGIVLLILLCCCRGMLCDILACVCLYEICCDDGAVGGFDLMPV